ncbi:MAG: serine hydrolase domain-containing protein [Candidatus Dormibacteraceae bacterium]
MAGLVTVDEVLARSVERGDVLGVAGFAADRNGVIFEGAFGKRDAAGQALGTDSVFWMASMTKALTTVAALQLVEQQKLTLDEPLSRLFPQLAEVQVLEGYDERGQARLRPARGNITLRNLATHTSGYAYDIWNRDLLRFYQENGIPNIIECSKKTLTEPLVFDPGTRWQYGINLDWIGQVVEKVADQDLEDYFRAHILGPLGMDSTSFVISPGMRAKLVEVQARDADGSLHPYPFEMPQQRRFLLGGAGLYGTGGDYLRFTRAIMHGGTLDGARILRPETVAEMGRNQIGDLEVERLYTAIPAYSNDAEFHPGMVKKWGLGFMLTTEELPTGPSANTLAWAGLGNTFYWIDPAKQVTGVILTQIFPFGDARMLSLLDEFQAALYKNR